jgi:hypothetical protein
MKRPLLTFGVLTSLWALPPGGLDQRDAATRAGFQRYVELTEARQAAELDGRAPFLWLDRQPAPARAALLDRLRRGEVVSARLETRDGGRAIDMGEGKVHHWIGTVLLPGVTLDRAIAFVQDYDRYPALFAPMVQRTRILRASPERIDVAMRTMSSKYGITVVIDADYPVEYRRLSARRLASKSIATNIFQVEAAGRPNERRIPGDQAPRGYLWQLHNYCWFDERPEGTYEQCESVSLSSDPGWFLNALFGRIINGIPRDTLEFTLSRVRAGLVAPRQ